MDLESPIQGVIRWDYSVATRVTKGVREATSGLTLGNYIPNYTGQITGTCPNGGLSVQRSNVR